ncbi:MAG: DUF58 domain-containing protein [Planctomycetota bacterium]
MSVEKYLKPNVIHQIKRLDLRAQFVVKGFLHGLHASPFHVYSVQFAEHRKYTPGDEPRTIDWQVYAKTDKYYVKKFEAETTIQGYLMMDLSESMDYTYRQDLTKFDYAVCLAAALSYLMVSQQDPVGLVTFSDRIRASLSPKSKRAQLNNILSLLAKARPTGKTKFRESVNQLAGMLRHKSLVMVFSDLLLEQTEEIEALYRLSHSGHDVILFHVLDEAEVNFPFSGTCLFQDLESDLNLNTNADQARADYLRAVNEYREDLAKRCRQNRIDYVPLDTSVQFDKALTEYLLTRRTRT